MGTPSLTSEIESPCFPAVHQSRQVLRKAIAPIINITMNKLLIALFVLVAIAAYVQGDTGLGHYGYGYAARHLGYKRTAEAGSYGLGAYGLGAYGAYGYAGYPYAAGYKREAEAEPWRYYGGHYGYKREAEAGGYYGGYPYRYGGYRRHGYYGYKREAEAGGYYGYGYPYAYGYRYSA